MNYHTVFCPHCGRELQIPVGAEKIVCMFCAQPIELPPETATDAGEAALLLPEEIFTTQMELEQLNEKFYPVIFERYSALIRPALESFLLAAETDPENAVERMADALFLGFSDQEKNRKKSARSFGCRFTITALLIPSVLELKKNAAERLADRFLEKWNAAFPKHPLGRATYAAICAGFRKKLCFITTAACMALGKGDTCPELQEFRHFRDGWLLHSPGGSEKISEYYLYAPIIVGAIEHSGEAGREFSRIWQAYLLPCLNALLTGKPQECAGRYEDMMTALEEKWLNRKTVL